MEMKSRIKPAQRGKRRWKEMSAYKYPYMDYGGSYAPVIGHKAIAEFETEEEAEKALKRIMQEG